MPLAKASSFIYPNKMPVLIRVDEDFYDENIQTVSDLLKDGEELIIDLTSTDLWLTVNVDI